MSKSLAQSPSHLFMVRPAAFGFNQQTGVDNYYQDANAAGENCAEVALAEFDQAVKQLIESGIQVKVFEDTKDPPKPDAIFPNNWISCHETGEVVLFPMATPNRRLERRNDIVAWLQNNFKVTRMLDLSKNEEAGQYLEGTGSIVFDHLHKRAFACRSHRTDSALLQQLCHDIGYTPQLFEATDNKGRAIYHTNVLLAIGHQWAVFCQDACEQKEGEQLTQLLKEGGRTVVIVSQEQVESLAGNCYEVIGVDGRMKLVMSNGGWESLRSGQRDALAMAGVDPVLCNVPTIERVGGGGIRCMMAPIFNPEQSS